MARVTPNHDHITGDKFELPIAHNKFLHARANTPAKKTIRRIQAWLDEKKNREIKIEWCWSSLKMMSRIGILIAYDDGIEVARRFYQVGNLRLPHPLWHKVYSGSWKHAALDSLAEALDGNVDPSNTKN